MFAQNFSLYFIASEVRSIFNYLTPTHIINHHVTEETSDQQASAHTVLHC